MLTALLSFILGNVVATAGWFLLAWRSAKKQRAREMAERLGEYLDAEAKP